MLLVLLSDLWLIRRNFQTKSVVKDNILSGLSDSLPKMRSAIVGRSLRIPF